MNEMYVYIGVIAAFAIILLASAIRILREYDVPVAVNYRVHQANQDDLIDAIALAQNLGAEQFNLLEDNFFFSLSYQWSGEG